MDRSTLDRLFEEIRREYDADITVKKVVPSDRKQSKPSFEERMDKLTSRQRGVFELARENAYYNDRGNNHQRTRRRLDVSKTTFLEHLRTAENHLLDPLGN